MSVVDPVSALSRSIASRQTPIRVIVVCAAVIVGLSACGSTADEETRRFANERQPTSVGSTATIAPSTETSAPPTAPPVVSPGALLATRGAPARLYFTASNELWTVGADGADPRPLLQLEPGQGQIRATAQAPGVAGETVAALIVLDEDGRETSSVVMLDGAGAEIRRIDDLQAVLGDDAAGAARAASLTWSPQGNQLLVTFGGGGVVGVPVDGEPILVLAPSAATGLLAAAWSPAGDAIAFLASTDPALQSDARRLVVAPITDGVLDPAAFTVASRDGDVVGAFAWLPDGSGLIYAERGEVGASGGDLFTVSAAGEDPRLVASAGRAAPVAQIVDFAVSPDGRSLAYTIATPDASGDELAFHSLWVRSLADSTTVAVPIPNGRDVTELWWTAAGLVWRSQPVNLEENASTPDIAFSLDRLDAESRQTVLFSVAPEGTPGASPEAAVAMPVAGGTPAATPAAASPAASPVGATPEESS